MSSRTVEALISVGVGLVAVVVLRWLLGRAFSKYEEKQAVRDPEGAARRHTSLGFARKVIVAFAAGIVVWHVLSLYPQTDQLMDALLASSAVLALFVGLAFNVPLSNLGSGMLVAFAQPLRLGDRVTVAEQTGFVEEMSLLYTTLVTDDERRVFIPNSQLTSSTIVNRTIRDPRRAISAMVPIRLDASIPAARETSLRAIQALPGFLDDTPRVAVGEIQGGAVRLEVTAYAPLGADVAQLNSDLRESLLGALASQNVLAVQSA